MNEQNKNPELITVDDVPKGRPDLHLVPDPVRMIELPEGIKPVVEVDDTPAAEQITLPESMRNTERSADIGAGVVAAAERSAPIPIDFPGPMAIRQNAVHLGGGRYMLPGQPPTPEIEATAAPEAEPSDEV